MNPVTPQEVEMNSDEIFKRALETFSSEPVTPEAAIEASEQAFDAEFHRKMRSINARLRRSARKLPVKIHFDDEELQHKVALAFMKSGWVVWAKNKCDSDADGDPIFKGVMYFGLREKTE